MPPSLYKTTLAQSLAVNGTETEVFVSSLLTMTGETINFTEWSPFTKGYIVVDPEAQFGTQPEIISFTGVDATGVGFTGITRGLSTISTSSITANKTYHATGSPVIIAWGAQNVNDTITYLNSLVTGANGNAKVYTATNPNGLTALSLAPLVANSPIAVGNNNSISGTAITTTNPVIDQAFISPYNMGYAADTGTTNTFAITLSPVPASYTAGMRVVLKAANANTGASTLNVNTLGAKTIKKNYNSDLISGDVLANQIIEVVYDGTNFQLASPTGQLFQGITAHGTANHDVSVTGSQAIAHGMGIAPKLVRINFGFTNGAVINVGFASYSGGGGGYLGISKDTSTGQSTTEGANLNLYVTIGSVWASVVIASIDATNINLTWGGNGSPTGIAHFNWDAIA